MVLLSDGKIIPTMRFFTIALFVRADSEYSSGTLFSYSVPGVPQDVIILSFTESQVKLTIKTEVVAADFKLPDNRWNYVGVVWDGTTGDVSVYINGPEKKRARNILKGKILLPPKPQLSSAHKFEKSEIFSLHQSIAAKLYHKRPIRYNNVVF